MHNYFNFSIENVEARPNHFSYHPTKAAVFKHVSDIKESVKAIRSDVTKIYLAVYSVENNKEYVRKTAEDI